TWSNGSLDWADNIKNPQGVINSVMDQLLPGSNILMHELAWTVEALDELLTKIEEQGYSFIDPRAIELEAR
ncbi:MAG: polysaccharide deacetylase family protein, partial [Bacilli bacterium]